MTNSGGTKTDMWFCPVGSDPWNEGKIYVARRPEYIEGAESHEFDLETAKSLKEEHWPALTFYVMTSDYEGVCEGESEKVHIETHCHVPERAIEILSHEN